MAPQLELIKQWLERAQADLGIAELARAEPRLTSEAAFHCQQAVEKALKAFLAHQNVDFAWSHDIEYLLGLCAIRDAEFRRFDNWAKTLTAYAVRFRYPRPDPDPTLEEAQAALTVARDIYNSVLQRIPTEAHPAD